MPIDDTHDQFAEFAVDPAGLWRLAESGVVLASDDGARFEATTFSLASAVDRILPALRTVVAKIRAGALAPSEVTVEVALQVGGETGLFFAKGTTEASMHVTLTWRADDGKAPSAT